MSKKVIEGRYKTLLLKLSGAAFGLAAMLSLSAALGPILLSHDDEGRISDIASPHMVVDFPKMDKDIRLAVESALHNADLAMETVGIDRLQLIVAAHAGKAEAYRQALERMELEIAVPKAIRQEVIDRLEQKLAKAERKLRKFKIYVAEYSFDKSYPYSIPAPKTPAKCSETEIIKDADKQVPVEGVGRSGGKRTSEAFYWI